MAFHVWKKALGCTTFQPHWKAFFNPKAPLLAQKNDALRLDARPPRTGVRGRNIDYIDSSVIRSRPELSYRPDDPQVQPSEFGFLREIRLHLKPGAGEEVAGLIQKISELSKMRNSRNYRFVSSSVIGPGSQVFFVVFPARDAADFYTQRASNAESPDAERQALISQINGLCRRVESVNYTIRRDLAYRPSN